MQNETRNEEKGKTVPDACPHCGHKLSQWQQVILNVDRVLMCKNCWYRIILDVVPKQDNTDDKNIEKE